MLATNNLDCECQFHETIAISNALCQIEVNAKQFKELDVLFSAQLRPCIAVVAKLKSDRYVLFHAFSASIKTLEAIQFCEYLKENEVSTIHIFAKNTVKQSYPKSIALAVGLSTQLPNDVDINVVKVDSYINIVTDVATKKIILTNDYILTDNFSSLENSFKKFEAKKIDLTQVVTLDNCVKELMELQKKGYFDPEDYEIPEKYLNKLTAEKPKQEQKKSSSILGKVRSIFSKGKDNKTEADHPEKDTKTELKK